METVKFMGSQLGETSKINKIVEIEVVDLGFMVQAYETHEGTFGQAVSDLCGEWTYSYKNHDDSVRAYNRVIQWMREHNYII